MNLKKLKTVTFIALATLTTLPTMGQDLLANQAPIDRKMKAVDSVAFNQLLRNEAIELPSTDLYQDWDNRYVSRVNGILPDEYRIDLRGFHMPTTSRVVTSNFGARWGRQHKGLDIKVYIGDTICAAFSGKVRIVRYEPRGYGNYVVIRHDNGLETVYGHMSKHLVRENQEVRAGQPIGLGGNTGRSTGSHLHFETRLCGVALNPALMFDFKNQDVVDDAYIYRKSSYDRESAQATRLRGVGGTATASAEPRTRMEVASVTSTRQNAVSSNTRFHKVTKGETLYSISRKRGISVDKLCKLNHIGKNFRLTPGQVLKYN
ncbi:MAG: peptidoglycan DD-metalloendopeptidase family protein [Prevotella sp.]|jgi:murein DD-endopeptidase MepM/ murein hydrolase activator NlpD|nr:peptidoglycan DD-metalloendopeptidase family protein [Prevotella sp.]